MTLEAAVRRYLDPDDPASVYLGIVHRLDRPTSGVLIWAKTPKAARRLSSQFERRRVVKEYWAIVESAAPASTAVRTPESESGEETWCDWLTRPEPDGLVRMVPPETPGARQAVTRVRASAAGTLPAASAWLRLWPQTGRTHQLRVQAAARGMPILGDSEYGSKTPFGPPHAIALQPGRSQIRHPILQTPMTLVAPIPPAWRRLGFDWRGAAVIGPSIARCRRGRDRQARLISTTLSLRTPRGILTSTCSPTCLPTSAWPIGLVIRILFWSWSSSPGPTRM